MTRFNSTMILFFSIIFLASAVDVALGSSYNVVCYWESWSRYRANGMAYGLNNIPVDQCTHVINSFSGLDSNTWKIMSLEPDFDIRQEGFKQFVALRKKNPDLKTLVAIGGWNEGAKKYSDMVSDAGRRSTFVNSVVEWMKEYDFDGLDLDWEYPGAADRGGAASDKQNFVLLCQELRAAFDALPRKRLLTMAVAAGKSRIDDGYNVPELSKYVDFFHVMTYDMRGSWDGFADHQAPLHGRSFDTGAYQLLNVEDSLKLWNAMGAPKEKLVMGVPFYARTYQLADPSNHNMKAPTQGGGNPGPYTQQSGYLAYFELCGHVSSYTREWDSVGKVPYMYSGNQWMGYDDTESITAKAQFVVDSGYAGAMIWAIDLDDYTGSCGQGINPLVTTLRSVLDGNPVVTTTPSPPITSSSQPPTSTKTTNPTKKPTPTSKPIGVTCKGRSEGDIFRVEPNCQVFYQCAAGVAYKKECPAKTLFDPTTVTCNWPSPQNSKGCNHV